jgi:hypothetical protein
MKIASQWRSPTVAHRDRLHDALARRAHVLQLVLLCHLGWWFRPTEPSQGLRRCRHVLSHGLLTPLNRVHDTRVVGDSLRVEIQLGHHLLDAVSNNPMRASMDPICAWTRSKLSWIAARDSSVRSAASPIAPNTNSVCPEGFAGAVVEIWCDLGNLLLVLWALDDRIDGNQTPMPKSPTIHRDFTAADHTLATGLTSDTNCHTLGHRFVRSGREQRTRI